VVLDVPCLAQFLDGFIEELSPVVAHDVAWFAECAEDVVGQRFFDVFCSRVSKWHCNDISAEHVEYG
jgi:hypothetical protein